MTGDLPVLPIATLPHLILLALVIGQIAEARTKGLCRMPCANGGVLYVDNSIWGHCRCRCPTGFLGPYCQYVDPRPRTGKRSVNNWERPVASSSRLDSLREIRKRLVPRSLDSDLVGELRFADTDKQAQRRNSGLTDALTGNFFWSLRDAMADHRNRNKVTSDLTDSEV